MTIFGFNTDVKAGDVVYHVQSEARQGDMLLQTMVFVKGQCVGKRAVSYAQKSAEGGFSEQAMHELLKAQHRAVLDEIQQGRIDSFLGTERGIQDVGGGLTLTWLNHAEQPNGSQLRMSFQVSDGGELVSGAEIAVSSTSPGAEPIASATTDAAGDATLQLSLTDEILQDSAVMARASHAGKSANRKFRFKKQT